MTNSLQLSQIEVSAFRRLRGPCRFDLAPGPGITILVGPNGSGKSTVLDAIEWALTDSASRLPDVGLSHSRQPNVFRTLGSEDEPKVILTFTGEHGAVERLSSGDGEARVGELLRRGDGPWSEIRSVAAALRWTHFSSQRSTARLGYESGDAILKAFAKPAGLERLKGLDQRLWGRDTQTALKDLERRTDDVIGQHETALERLSEVEPESAEEASAAVARRLVDLVTALRDEPGLSLDPRIMDLSVLEETLTAFRSRLEITLGEFRTNRSAMRESRLRAKRLEIERDEAAHSLATAENSAERRLEACGLAEVEKHNQQAELDRLNAMRGALSGALSARSQLTEIEAAKIRLQRTLADLRIKDAAANQTLEKLTELEILTSRLRAASSLRELDDSLADLARFGDPEVAQARINAQIADLENRRDELTLKRLDFQNALMRENERLQSLKALASAIANHLHDADTECPVCAEVYPAGELARRAHAAATVPSPAAELVARTVKETTQELGRLSGQLRLAQSQADEARVIASTVARQTAERERLVTLLEPVQHTPEAFEEIETRMLDLREELNVEEDREIRALRMTNDDTRRAVALDLLDAETRLARAEAELEALSRQPQGDRPEGELRAELRVVENQIDRANVQLTAAMAEHGLAIQLLEGAEASVRRLRELHRAATDALLDEQMNSAGSAQVLASLLAGHSEEGFISSVEEQSARIGRATDRVAALREELAKVRRSNATDVVTLLRATYLPKAESAEIADLREVISAQLGRARSEREALNVLRKRLSRRARERRDIDQRLHGTALRPWNDLFKAVYASLAGSLGETLEWTANRVDMRMRGTESHVRPSVAGEAIPGWLAGHYFSEGQLAALQISAMITASVLLPWSRWPALLLDDPLQHADVIKVGAFADLIRSLCADMKHQIVMTTHDRIQAEFIAAKFSAGGLATKIIPFERTLPAHQAH